MCAFSILQKWPKIAKMTPYDLLTLEMALIEPPRKNEAHGNHAKYEELG